MLIDRFVGKGRKFVRAPLQKFMPATLGGMLNHNQLLVQKVLGYRFPALLKHPDH